MPEQPENLVRELCLEIAALTYGQISRNELERVQKMAKAVLADQRTKGETC